MASLHIQSPLTTTTHSKYSYPFTNFTKPPHFSFHDHQKRQGNNKLFTISCSGDHENHNSPHHDPSKVDRRNMLLGLGGMYGASSLIMPSLEPAFANPIPVPDLNKCTPPTDVFSGKELDAKCCLKSTGSVTDYVLPQFDRMRIRPSAHTVSKEYIFKYNLATDRMRRLPKDDPRNFLQQANIHCAYCNNVYDQSGTDKNLQVHFSWIFFPFHRWYLYFYERILGKLIDDPTFALPFWNWDNPKGMTMPPMFMDQKVAPALYDAKRDQSHITPAVVDLGLTGNTNADQLRTNNLRIMFTEMIRGNSTVSDFMGCPVREGGTSTPAMQGASERGSHTAIHAWVGDPKQDNNENMGNFYSAGRDPLFYCHHANVDRMWTLWQYFLPSRRIPDKTIKDPDYLNSSFLFYDENANLVRVYVKDCLDNLRMGYDLERIDLPWIDFRPPRQSAQAKVKRSTTTASKPEVTFPLTLDKVSRVLVPKTKKGATAELLQINFTVDTTKLLKFDVFINDEDDDVNDLNKAAYAGTYAQLPHKGKTKDVATAISLRLTDLYEDMDVSDDDSVVITLVPRHQGPGVTISGIKVVAEPPATGNQTVYSCPSA